jgi:hypothetical protein
MFSNRTRHASASAVTQRENGNEKRKSRVMAIPRVTPAES